MAMVDVDNSSLQADSQSKSVDLIWGSAAAWRCPTFISDEPGELLQWLWHDDSTIHFFLSNFIVIIIITIIILVLSVVKILSDKKIEN